MYKLYIIAEYIPTENFHCCQCGFCTSVFCLQIFLTTTISFPMWLSVKFDQKQQTWVSVFFGNFNYSIFMVFYISTEVSFSNVHEHYIPVYIYREFSSYRIYCLLKDISKTYQHVQGEIYKQETTNGMARLHTAG